MNEKLVDLHTHSTASDGAASPSKIIDLASELNLAAVALTDHDTVSGIDEFLDHAKKINYPAAIPGVEMSVDFQKQEVHIVGLFTDHHCQPLLELLREIRNNRNCRNELIITKLQNMGYEITLDEVLAVAEGESIGRPHFARILIDKGYFSETQEVFDKCLKRGAPCYCPRVLPKPNQAIGVIHQAGGLAIWAHAVYRRKNERSYVRNTLKELTKYGLDGIEAYYSVFTSKQQKMLLEMAEEFDLLVSGGSDYHGQNQPSIALGSGIGNNLQVPEKIYTDLLKFADKYK